MKILNILKTIDLKTWLILMLGVMIVSIIVLNRPGPNPLSSELTELRKKHRQELREIEDRNQQLEQRIQDYLNIIEKNRQDNIEREKRIQELSKMYTDVQRERDRLKKELAKFESEFKEMSDKDFVNWLKDFFKDKGIKP